MFNNILKNKMYMAMIFGVFLSIVSFITCLFIENKTYFTGTFNGNGHTINNLTYNATITDTSVNPPAFGL